MLKPIFVVFLAVFSLASTSQGDTYRKSPNSRPAAAYKYETANAAVSRLSPWDFTGFLGLYNPGVGFGGMAAYRFLENLTHRTDDALSLETGLTFITASDTFQNSNISYSVVEIPFQVRWDFRLDHGKFVVGPRAGFNYISGSSGTVNGYTYTRFGGIYAQIGAYGMYYFSENFGVRVGFNLGSYTSLQFGVNYAL